MKRTRKHPAPKATKPTTKKAKSTSPRPPKDVPTATTPKAPAPRDPRLPAPGATLDRVYKGKTIRLKFGVGADVEVDGEAFTSLSAAARHVTGAASINGFLWAGLAGKRPAAPSKPSTPTPPSTTGGANDLATPAGQRAALAAAGITKRGRPIGRTADRAKRPSPTPKAS
jgi:hypothetical protein